jgi:microcystin-dependent protein
MSDPFIGEICPTPYTFSPYGWAYCSGQLLSVQQFSALYAILGNTFGGTFNQTFGVPNLKATVPMGFGAGPGLTNRLWASSTGTTSVQLTAAQLPTHDHATKFATGASTQQNPQGNYQARLQETTGPSTFSTRPIFETTQPVNINLDPASVTATGGNGAHENQQPFLALNFCIALQGVYPVHP